MALNGLMKIRVDMTKAFDLGDRLEELITSGEWSIWETLVALELVRLAFESEGYRFENDLAFRAFVCTEKRLHTSGY